MVVKKPSLAPTFFLPGMIYLQTAGFSSGPAWTRTRDLFLIRDKTVCRGCSLLFDKSCKVAPFRSAVVVCVHRCSGALSSNCRQLLSSLRRTG
jgi:hypothetical protein